MNDLFRNFWFGLRLLCGGIAERVKLRLTIRALLRNVRVGLRMLRRSPGFTTVAVTTLAVGVGANTAIFSVVYAVLLAPMPYPNPDQLVMVWSKVQGHNNGVSAGDFLDWRRQNKTFQDLLAWTDVAYNFATPEQPERIVGRAMTPGAYRMMGDHLFLGRDFLPEEGEVGKEHEVILTHKLWKHLGADRDIIGKQIKMNGELYTVVGVNPPGQTDRLESQFVVPLAFKPEQINHDFHWLLVIGRLKPGISIAQAQADMDVVTGRIAQEHPQSNKGWSTNVEMLHLDFFPRNNQKILWLLLGSVGLVLLIACVMAALVSESVAQRRFTVILLGAFASLALLLAATGLFGVVSYLVAERTREFGVRMALGAARKDIYQQVLARAARVSLIGCSLGLLVSIVTSRLLVANLYRVNRFDLQTMMIAPMLLLSVALLAAYLPARRAAKVDPMVALRYE